MWRAGASRNKSASYESTDDSTTYENEEMANYDSERPKKLNTRLGFFGFQMKLSENKKYRKQDIAHKIRARPYKYGRLETLDTWIQRLQKIYA